MAARALQSYFIHLLSEAHALDFFGRRLRRMRRRLCCRRMRNAIGRKDIKVHEDVASMSPGLLLFSTSKAQLWMFRCHGRSLSLMLCFIIGKNRANKSHNALKIEVNDIGTIERRKIKICIEFCIERYGDGSHHMFSCGWSKFCKQCAGFFFPSTLTFNFTKFRSWY